MELIKIQDGVQTPYNMGQLRRDNRSVSFPKTVNASTLQAYGVYSVVEAAQPDYNKTTQSITRAESAVNVNGQWTYNWVVEDKTSESLAAEQRSKRDELIAKTDWTANSDVTMSAAMATYRQALRDVPAQAGFPSTVTWPEEPAL